MASRTWPSGFKMATDEQGITKDQYVRDSVWPSAALKKITGSTIQVTEDDLQKGYQANYGERVRCRAIVLGEHASSPRGLGQGAAEYRRPDYLRRPGRGVLDRAEQQSAARRSAADPPFRRPAATRRRRVRFEAGELSGIIQLGDRFVILKCEGRTEPVEVNPQEVHDILYQDIFEKKLRMAMSEKFDEIRSKARIDNYLANTSQSPDRVKADGREAAAGRIDGASVRPPSN